MAYQGPLRRQLSTELGLFGDLLDISGDQGRGATQPNPDLGISGVDRVGHLFGHLGPLWPGFPNLPEGCLSEEFRQGRPIAVRVVGWGWHTPLPGKPVIPGHPHSRPTVQGKGCAYS